MEAWQPIDELVQLHNFCRTPPTAAERSEYFGPIQPDAPYTNNPAAWHDLHRVRHEEGAVSCRLSGVVASISTSTPLCPPAPWP